LNRPIKFKKLVLLLKKLDLSKVVLGRLLGVLEISKSLKALLV
jgi:hypothetical protein